MNIKLKEILSEVFEIKENTISMDLTKDDIDNWDSLKQMDLVVSIEEGFNIELEMEEIIKMDSIENIYKVLEAKGTI